MSGVRSCLDFVQDAFKKSDLGLAPGYPFGLGNDECSRVCFAQSHERLEEALRRLCGYLDCNANEFER
ncbi:MAG: aspartate aminotransferase [Gammaproteobacteria bacterium]